MGKLLTVMRNAPKRSSALVAMIAAAIVVPAALFAWGPDRPTYTTEKPADHVTFNSITNNPVRGDERNFVQVREKDGSLTYVDDISLSAGKEYVVSVYFHNNAASNLNASGIGIAHGASVRAEIPAIVPSGSAGTKAVGYVSAANAAPQQVWDHVNFKNATAGDIALRLVPGSATMHSLGKVNGATLPDSIITTGAPLGYDALDGKVPGCNEFAGYVTFRVKADQADFTVQKQVRKTGTTGWKESVAAKPGESVDYLVNYENKGTTWQNDVIINDILPKGLVYTPGTTKLANSTNPSGIKVSDNVTKGGINIGNYKNGSNAFVMFSATVAKNDELPVCGANTLRNVAKAQTNNGTKEDSADVTVDKTCVVPKDIKVCDLASKKIITIKEDQFDAKKHSKNLKDCEVQPGKITVCELASKKIITIDENKFDASKHSKNVKDCETTPVTPPTTPAELPKTGAGDGVAAALALGALVASASYYVASRRLLGN
ncbi:MAG: LPXTG cell wall anchor domain-containing protein [Candidatus Saccharimonadales bacterium]